MEEVPWFSGKLRQLELRCWNRMNNIVTLATIADSIETMCKARPWSTEESSSMFQDLREFRFITRAWVEWIALISTFPTTELAWDQKMVVAIFRLMYRPGWSKCMDIVRTGVIVWVIVSLDFSPGSCEELDNVSQKENLAQVTFLSTERLEAKSSWRCSIRQKNHFQNGMSSQKRCALCGKNTRRGTTTTTTSWGAAWGHEL